MELLPKHMKLKMEECKRRARDAGLEFRDETLEFVITNEDMIRLSPKGMIPTLYDYWVHDVFVLQDKGKYEFYPSNPYETVINTRPSISFYNDNNPDWLNVMIFYHVLAHIDFFQNNIYFARTWLDDFLGKAQAHAAVMSELRHEHGRWVDYVIEFARGIDNLVNFYDDLNERDRPVEQAPGEAKFGYFFDVFLQEELKVTTFQYIEELNRYNDLLKVHGSADTARNLFLVNVSQRYPNFDVRFEKRKKDRKQPPADVMEYLMEHSPFLKKTENEWMKNILQIVRETALYFQPQIRTKILNEGWASYWHEHLFMTDEVLRTHEFQFSKINAGVVSIPRVGLNPYAVGLRLFKYLEAKADRGMLTYDFEKIRNVDQRFDFDAQTGKGRDFIFDVRRYYSDATSLNEFVDQDFCNEFKLFVVGKRINHERKVLEYYVKSRRAEDYKRKMLKSLYHPPCIRVDHQRTAGSEMLHLVHEFEGKELVKEYIANTMIGLEFLWGRKVLLETNEIDEAAFQNIPEEDLQKYLQEEKELEFSFQKVRYSMVGKQLPREVIGTAEPGEDTP